MRFTWPPYSVVTIERALFITQLGQSLGIGEEQQPGGRRCEHVIELQRTPDGRGRECHLSGTANAVCPVPAGRVVHDSTAAAAALELPVAGGRPQGQQLAALLDELAPLAESALLQADGQEHHPGLKRVHLARQQAQGAIDGARTWAGITGRPPRLSSTPRCWPA